MAATSLSRSRSGCSARCSASRNGEVDCEAGRLSTDSAAVSATAG